MRMDYYFIRTNFYIVRSDYYIMHMDYYSVYTNKYKSFSWIAISCIRTVILCAHIITPCHQVIILFASIKISCSRFVKLFVPSIKLLGQISKSCKQFSKSLAWNANSYAQSIIPFEQLI